VYEKRPVVVDNLSDPQGSSLIKSISHCYCVRSTLKTHKAERGGSKDKTEEQKSGKGKDKQTRGPTRSCSRWFHMQSLVPWSREGFPFKVDPPLINCSIYQPRTA
jgi:hypothetical protein